MSYGPISNYFANIASGASTSSDIVLGGRSWKNIMLRVGTMSTGVNLNIDGKAVDTDGYYQCFHPSINSSTVTNNPFVVSAGVGSGGGIVPIPNGLPIMRIRGTGVISGGCSFTLICSD